MVRKSEVKRTTTETDISLRLLLDGSGINDISTGIGFFDHMLTLFAKHGGFDLIIKCKGDTHVDGHHTVEDIGVCLGTAFAEALGDARGIRRYGDITLPMDEALVLCAIDISGRGHLTLSVKSPDSPIGSFDPQLLEEFLLAFVRKAGITVHIRQLDGKNTHHIIEACFKALARALREAVSIDSRFSDEIPSTKGIIV